MLPDQEPDSSPSVIKKSISLPDALYEAAQRRAAAEHRTFSSYIQNLIAKDVASGESSSPAEGESRA